MPKLTAISPQRRRPDRLNLFIDGEFWSGITAPVWEKIGLSIGQELTAEDLERLKVAISEGDAMQKALDLLSRRSYSRGILRDKLLAREYGTAVVEHCLDRCEDLYLLNDQRYAEALGRGALNGRRAKRWLLRKLQEKKIENELAEKVADEAYPEGTERELATKLLAQKYTRPLNNQELQKASNWLLRRGYASDELRPLLSELRQEATTLEQKEPSFGPEALETWKRKINRRWPLWQTDFKEKQKVQAYLLRQGVSFSAMKDLLEQVKPD